MGCDIHAYYEGRVLNTWYHIGELQIPRNYKLFTLMAGVREDVSVPSEYIKTPKGIPVNLSEITSRWCDYYLKIGTHSHSWLSLEELKQIPIIYNNLQEINYIDYHIFSYLYRTPKDLIEELELDDLRLIFWFDS